MARRPSISRFDKHLPIVGGAHLAQRLVEQTRIPEAPPVPKPTEKPTRLLFSLISILFSVVSIFGYVTVMVVETLLIARHPEWMESKNAKLGLSLLPLTGSALNFAGIGFALSAWFQRSHRRSVICIALGANLLLLFAYSALIMYAAVVSSTKGD